MKDDFKLDRRSFLRGTGAVGAVALFGAPTLLRAAPMCAKLSTGSRRGSGSR